jgi:hypothetical protein
MARPVPHLLDRESDQLEEFVETEYTEETAQQAAKSKIHKRKIAMKIARIALSLLLLATATAAFSQTPAQKSFDELKSLTGLWEGTNAQGKPLQVSFRETAGGTALMSELRRRTSMTSMIYLDGANRLLITHYCNAGNQPRMQASVSPDGKTITFDYFDITNVASPEDDHIVRIVFTILDANHHTEEWTSADHGSETKELFDLHRSTVAQK